MKKIIAVIIAGLIMLQAGTVAYARSQPTVYLHAPSVITSELSEVSVRIKDNSGLMGIKLSVEYPAAQVDVRSIAKGEVLNVGDFATDFGEQIGHFQVLWHHTKAVKTNGVLFTFQIQKKPISIAQRSKLLIVGKILLMKNIKMFPCNAMILSYMAQSRKANNPVLSRRPVPKLHFQILKKALQTK